MKVTRWDMFTLSFWRQTTASWGITVSEWEPLVFGLFISKKSNYTLLNTSQQVLLNYVMRWKGPITWKKVPNGTVVHRCSPGKKQIKCQWKCSLKMVTKDFNTQQLLLIITGWCHVFNCAHLMASSWANPFRGQCLWVFTYIPSPVIDWLASMREKTHFLLGIREWEWTAVSTLHTAPLSHGSKPGKHETLSNRFFLLWRFK